jgi:hypothetical protein
MIETKNPVTNRTLERAYLLVLSGESGAGDGARTRDLRRDRPAL